MTVVGGEGEREGGGVGMKEWGGEGGEGGREKTDQTLEKKNVDCDNKNTKQKYSTPVQGCVCINMSPVPTPHTHTPHIHSSTQ